MSLEVILESKRVCRLLVIQSVSQFLLFLSVFSIFLPLLSALTSIAYA